MKRIPVYLVALMRIGLLLPVPLLLTLATAKGGGVMSDSSRAPATVVPWTFSVGGYYYSLPRDEDFTIGVGIAERGSLHLEARYNYEDRKTGSLFAGWTVAAGESFTVFLTPMAGVAFGQTTGVIPALQAGVGYGIADLYLESEYLIDLNESADSFFYSWLEIGLSPLDLFRLGFVAQRTRIFETPLVVDRGPFASLTPEMGALSMYAFNLFTESWFLVLAVRVEW